MRPPLMRSTAAIISAAKAIDLTMISPPDDVSGVCLPAPSSDSLDVLRRLLALRLAKRVQEEASKMARHSGHWGRWLDFLADAIQHIEPVFLARAFDPIPSTSDVPIDADKDNKDPRAHAERVVNCIRYVVGLPHGAPLQPVPIPPVCFKES